MKNQVKKFGHFINENFGEEHMDQSDMRKSNRMDGSKMEISLDWGTPSRCDEFLDDLQQACKRYNVNIIGFIPYGPAGGNPEITFEGSASDIKSLIEWYHQDSGEDSDYMFNTYAKQRR